MNVQFKGKVVLVTGASTGIGAAFAEGFAKAGAKVAVHYNSSEADAKAVAKKVEAAGTEALLVKADVTDAKQATAMVDAVVAKFGKIDVLVNNAGGLLKRYPIVDMPDEAFFNVINLNITSVFRITKAAVPHMKKNGGGSILNISSIAARDGGGNGAVVYASAKAFVSTFTRGLAKELAPDKIRVNGIAPGFIQTPFHEKYTPKAGQEAQIARIPIGHAGAAEDLVGMALLLSSEELSRFTTGEVVDINGGALMA